MTLESNNLTILGVKKKLTLINPNILPQSTLKSDCKPNTPHISLEQNI